MTDLLNRIQTLLANKAEQQEAPHSFTSFSIDQITNALIAELPSPQNEREKEVLYALKKKRYSRCRLYLQLVDNNAFIEAVNLIIEVLEAAHTGSAILPDRFNRCVYKIAEAIRQGVLATGTDKAQADIAADRAISTFEKIAIDLFAKGLGDEGSVENQRLPLAA